MLIKRLPFLALLLFASIIATAQTPTPSIVGTWVLTSADKLLPNGTRVSDYGEHPHGLVIFTRDGYYSVQIYRADRLKFSSGDKPKGTPEEYKDASLSTSVHFGRYTLDPAHATITFHIDRSSFPNQDDTTQVRPYQLKGDQLSWKVPPRPDGSIPITVLHRVTSEEHPPVKGLN
ncbi:MAG: lipocalin-like domain-containing protein, partial [Acidobacteriaceae bacterium]